MFYEAWEGQRGSASVWTVMLGCRFSERSTLRAEWGPRFGICGEAAATCHRHALLGSLSLLRRVSQSAYLLFGPIHVGFGAGAFIGREVSISGEVDLSYRFDSAALRPRVLISRAF